ncbi:hypothetical protein EUAN_11810 [Andreesenia angusta]|uniref:PDZ domain-containing protein n=1 Tax=Andreesenia angusta TaxID=39480 RepID=A0A1S1V7L2_9FIRM|nr:DUF512 domain-containing protein [Andreesenia angusta]OHW62616.1 hypothetical protein EUAN_11810 [Andreesenia angusta]
MELKNLNENINIVEEVSSGSIAEELGIEPGDIILSVNGESIKDIIDYKYMVTDDYVEMDIQKPDGEIWELEIEKEPDEDIGISFTNPLIDQAKNCRNKCIFCFIDQLPKGMRETLYFKDDDSRLSFLQGNFVTLTNMSEEEIERIIRYRISPINISVHTTDPELRVKMLCNKNAGRLYGILERFSEAGIEMNCQIVAVPGINDGENLDRTLKDLSRLYPNVNSVAIVPIGVTKYREGLYPVEIYDRSSANEMVKRVEALQKKYLSELKTRFAFISDEFYILSGVEIPDADYYEGFPQLENGIGLIRSFEDEIVSALKQKPENRSNKRRYTIATGKLAYEFMKEVAELVMSKYRCLEIAVVEVENEFFGRDITVAGLLTGSDILKALEGKDVGDVLLVSRSMMKRDEEIFLDDITLQELGERLGVEVVPSEVDGAKFVEIFEDKE